MSSISRPRENLKPSHDRSPRRVVIQQDSTYTSKPFRGVASAHIPSRIPVDHMISKSGPIREKGYSPSFDEESSTWKSVLLPRHHPDSRKDVQILDEWITTRLADAVAMSQQSATLSGKQLPFVDSAKLAEEQLKIMDLGFSEIVRQVAVQCSQRAELMHRMWRASHELYDKLLVEMTSVIDGLRYSAADWKEKCELLQKQMELQNWRHEKEIKQREAASKSNKSEDSQVYREMQEELFLREKDMRIMENTLADLSIWFPNFQTYCNSILRKHLPPIDDPTGTLLVAGQKHAGTGDIVLPQDLLYKDLKLTSLFAVAQRLQKLDIGFVVRSVDDDAELSSSVTTVGRSTAGARNRASSAHKLPPGSRPQSPQSLGEGSVDSAAPLPPLSPMSPQMTLRKISLLQRPAKDSATFRSLMVENQLQNVVVEELQNKYNRLVEKFQEEEANWNQRIDFLSVENGRLKERLEGYSTSDALRRMGPILQPMGLPSVAWEMSDLFFGKKTHTAATASPPSAVISVSDIQKTILQFCTQFLTNSSPLSWAVHKGAKNEGGRELISEERSWILTGNMGGIRGAELKVMNFETMYSKYLVQQLGGIRPARDRLRKVMWSILVWSQQQFRSSSDGGSGSRFDSVVDALPRSILEHEKSVLKVFALLFGLGEKNTDKDGSLHSGMVTVGSQQLVEDAETGQATGRVLILREPMSGLDDIFLNIFMRSISAMQRFVRYNQKNAGGSSGQSTSLFMSGASSPVPEKHLDRILSRIFVVSVGQGTYTPISQRRVSLSVAAAAISAGEKVAITQVESSKSVGMGESWWSYLPSRVFAKIKDDVKILVLKNAGEFAEAFDIIMAIWANMLSYHSYMHGLLEDLFKYLDGTVGGPAHPVFNTLLLFILEREEVVLSSQHKLLPLELLQLAAESRLTASTFADTVLGKSDVLLTGLHVLFDGGPRMKREIKREGEQMLQALKRNFTEYSSFEGEVEVNTSGTLRTASVLTTAALSHSPHTYSAHNEASRTAPLGDTNGSIVAPAAATSVARGAFDAVIAQAELCFSAAAASDPPGGAEPSSRTSPKTFQPLNPDQYFSLQSMKCISLLNMVTRSNCPIAYINAEATACRHRVVSLLRRTFRAWQTATETWRECSDSEDSDDGGLETGRQSSSLYEGSRTELATITSDREDKEEEDFIPMPLMIQEGK